MGLWYFLILFVGIILIVVGARNKNVSNSKKIVIFCFTFGILLIVMSFVLFLPGSSTILDQLFGLN